MTAAPFMAPLFAGLFFGWGSEAEHNPCGSGLAREGFVSGDEYFVGVHIRFCGNGVLSRCTYPFLR
jgi:hypothetical protein